MFLGPEQCNISVKYVMCSRLEAYLSASGQDRSVSQTKTLSSFYIFNKYVLFISKMKVTQVYLEDCGSSQVIFAKNLRGIIRRFRHKRCDSVTTETHPPEQTRRDKLILRHSSLYIHASEGQTRGLTRPDTQVWLGFSRDCAAPRLICFQSPPRGKHKRGSIKKLKDSESLTFGVLIM